MTNYDVIVVGGGHNGLICANYLAKSGKKVLVLETRDAPGGCAATSEIHPGFKVSSCAQWLDLLNPSVIQELNLKEHGLEFAAENLITIGLNSEGNHVFLSHDSVDGKNISDEDKSAYIDFKVKMLKYAKLLNKVFESRAPKLVEHNWTDRITLAKLALGMKLLGKEDMNDLMRLILINIYDVMEESFENPNLKALISFDGVLGGYMGPRSPNTVFNFLYKLVGETYGYRGSSQIKGGMGALGEALAASAKDAGVEIRLNSRVAEINKTGSRVSGVTLDDGEIIHSNLIVSNADPFTTFNNLLGLRNIEAGMARRVTQIRRKSGTAKLHLALDTAPNFSGLDSNQMAQRLLIAPDMNYIERAFNAVKYSEYSNNPAIDISISSLNDEGLAPPGKHVLSAIVQYAPYDPEGGWDAHRDVFAKSIIDLIEQYAPGISKSVLSYQLVTPKDLESNYGMTGGQWHHVEMTLDQVLMMRPFPGASQYGVDVDGLYLCGAGTHPGGGLMGLAGKNAATEIIKRGSEA